MPPKTTTPASFEHNVFIIWKPEYNMNIPIIDEQHRGIVTIFNSLHFGMQNNYVKDMLAPIVDMIYDYTRIHFQIEEDFINEINYPHAKEHHALHEELMSRLNHIGRKSILDKDPYELMEFLKNWWIGHICNEDFQVKKFYEQ